jgi:hypothetical protein
MACPPTSGAATFRTIDQHASSRAPLSSRVHERDETTVGPVRGAVSRAPARVPECTIQQESCQLLDTHMTSPHAGAGARRDARDARVLPFSPCGLQIRPAPVLYLSQFERGLSWCMRVGVEVAVAEERRSQKTTGSMPIGSRSCSVAACSPRAPLQKKPPIIDLGCCLPGSRA